MQKKKIFYKIISTSMLPTFDIGDIIICGKKEPKNIKIGDIVVIKSDFFLKINRDSIFFQKYRGLPIIHRVIYKEKKEGMWFFKTKGDNNSRIDTAIQILEKNEDYILVEYDPSKAILIPETEIIGVVLNKISKTCSKCGIKILNDLTLKSEHEGLNDFGNFKKVELKFYFNKNKKYN